MMSLLDPSESKRIGELLDNGEAVAAAGMLSVSKHVEHKAVRPLVSQCIEQLAEMAEDAFTKDDCETAARHIRMAATLRPLSGHNAQLEAKIERTKAEQDQLAATDDDALAHHRQLQAAGRFRTSLERKGSVEHLAEGKSLRSAADASAKRYERYCDECRKFLDQGDLQIAASCLAKAKEENADYPEVRALDRELRAKLEDRRETSNEEDRDIVRAHDKGMILDFGDPDLNTVVWFGNTLILGAPMEKGTHADIMIHGAGFLNRQHAIITRHAREYMKYWIAAHPALETPEGRVAVERDGERRELRAGDMFEHVELMDGDLIHLQGVDLNEQVRQVTLVFRQRVDANGIPRHTCVFSIVSSPTTLLAAKVEEDSVYCRYIAVALGGSTHTCNPLLQIGAAADVPDIDVLSLQSGTLMFDCRQQTLTVDSSDLRILRRNSDGAEAHEYHPLKFGDLLKVRPPRQIDSVSQVISPQSALFRVRIHSV